MSDPSASQEDDLVEQILGSQDSSTVVETVLRTDDRVIARITDGIYRQPGSALRELIANAYDADADEVVIRTDRPRFSAISVEDNGVGMSPTTLAHLIHHIGSSAKRNAAGPRLGVTLADDSSQSKGGRRLIGKMGIGLFSVSQLTRSFQIITKERGEQFRTIATVMLRQFDDLAADDEEEYEAGVVNIWREPATDVDSQGTTILLTKIRPQTRETLQSLAFWSDLFAAADERASDDDAEEVHPPKYNIGAMVPGSSELLFGEGDALSALPWTTEDPPVQAFANLVRAVWNEVAGRPNPKLADIFDYYLNMAWQLGLAVPVEYYDGHPFHIPLKDAAAVYEVPQSPSESPKPIELTASQTIGKKLKLTDGSSADSFKVFLDDLELRRPIRFQNLPVTNHKLKKPIIFAGRAFESFEKVTSEFSGGPLRFEAYLIWSPKIVPVEHQGVLVRIHGASGTLFDSTFMRYQVAEQTRLKQITCEIFVSEGLEGALNIDRESFNFAHPHYIYLSRWLHAALRRLATVQKKLASEVRDKERKKKASESANRLDDVVQSAWTAASGDPDLKPPTVVIGDTVKPDDTESREEPTSDQSERFVFDRTSTIPPPVESKPTPAKLKARELKLTSIAQILAAYDLLDLIPPERQQQLLRSIYDVIQTPEQ